MTKASSSSLSLSRLPCAGGASTESFVLHDGTGTLGHFGVDAHPRLADHGLGVVGDRWRRWEVFVQENVAVWSYDTSFETMTPEGQRFLLNFIRAFLSAPLRKPPTPRRLQPGRAIDDVLAGGERRIFLVRSEGRSVSAELSWDCRAEMHLFEGRRDEGVFGPSPLKFRSWRPHDADEDAVIELVSYGLADGTSCAYSLRTDHGPRLTSRRRGPPAPWRIPPLGGASVLAAAAALAFAAYASARGLRVNAGKGASLAVGLGLFGAVTGYFGGLNTGRLQEAGILLATGLFAAAAGRTGRSYRGTRAALFAAGAAVTFLLFAAMAVLSLAR